jgi:uncharacterized protein YjbI with pentapeptide repeats
MFPKKSAKPTKKAFTNEQIRARAYQIWEKNKEQSEEDNWNAAIKALERERRFRVLIGIWRWTGLGEKKGWDIVTGLSIPLVVFVGGIWFNSWNSQQQQEVAEQKQKDELLKTYLNDMKGFLLDEKHPLKDSSKNGESKSIARAITLTTLAQLNGEKDVQRKEKGLYNQRKGLIMQFLFESGLIKFNSKVAPIISLNTADFTFANLERANLERANLERANLTWANLERANLTWANLERANLERANLQGAILERAILGDANLKDANLKDAYLQGAYLDFADLQGAILKGAILSSADLSYAKLYFADLSYAYLTGVKLYFADLSYANLTGVNLTRADLSDGNLEGANLTGVNLYKVLNLTSSQVKTACNWKKAIYIEAEFDENTFSLAAKDKTANQKKIDKIKQDKASDPATPPNCSMWK